MKQLLLYIITTIFLFSCSSRLETALDSANANRAELEKVLEHFKNDKNPLKYEAAVFLIENMQHQYTYHGEAVDKLDKLYLSTSTVSQNKRTEFFNNHATELLSKGSLHPSFDINGIKADYLIKAIDDACEVWCRTPWHEEYDKSVFFEYVLPYRLDHEPLSDWRNAVSNEFPLLTDNVVLSRRGMLLEAETAEAVGCIEGSVDGASNGRTMMLTRSSSSLSFPVCTERNVKKRFIIKYSTPDRMVHALVRINGKVIDTLHLAPSRNMVSFAEKWHHKAYSFNKGENSLTICSPSDSLSIDYVQLGAIEDIKSSDLPDFSSHYYSISNKKSGKYITLDTSMVNKTDGLELLPYQKGNGNQHLRLDSEGYPLWKIAGHDCKGKDICLEMTFGTPRVLAPDSIVTVALYENRPFMQWAFLSAGGKGYRIMNKHTGMFLDIRRDGNREVLVQKPYSLSDSQIWVVKRWERNMNAKTFFTLNSPISEAMRVLDITHAFEYFIHNGPYLSKGSSLVKAKSGKCADETAYSILLSRYLGIPAAYDFTPHWGNRSGTHSWSVLIDKDGNTVPFYMGNMPGDTAHYFYSYLKPKVFRYKYSLNDEIISDLNSEKSVPPLFVYPRYTDVTDQYYNTVDVKREVPDEHRDKNIAYICVFDNRNWVPVFYGKIAHGSVTYKSMGRGIVYMSAVYEDDKIIPFGNPFVVKTDGKIEEIQCDKKKKITMTLNRKYPFMGAQDFFNSRMDGGQFQGADKPDFSDAVILHTHKGITNGNWYSIPVKSSTTFRYLRYMGGRGSFCNINELEFFDNKGEKINGEIIGTEGESWCPKERVFDGDILTGFGGLSPDGNWVGLKLRKPTPISRIRYIGRNDGNCVERGDRYELYSWNVEGYWELIGSQTATDNNLHFHNVHSGGLYILKDVTKGVEERIFTYEKNKQIWW